MVIAHNIKINLWFIIIPTTKTIFYLEFQHLHGTTWKQAMAKGAPDGMSTLKRTTDRLVAEGKGLKIFGTLVAAAIKE